MSKAIRLRGRVINQDGVIDIDIYPEDLVKQLSEQGVVMYGRTLKEIREIIEKAEGKK